MTARIGNSHQCYALLLAAGASRRLGQAKQLLDIHGQPLIMYTCDQLGSVFAGRICIVLGANHELIEAKLGRYQSMSVINHHWQEGIASSIRTGINALPDSAQAVCIALVDQVSIHASHYQQLLNSWQQHPDSCVASEYEFSLGVPAIFPHDYFSKLLNLHGDEGAKRLLNSSKDVLPVSLPEAGFDLDLQADYQQFINAST